MRYVRQATVPSPEDSFPKSIAISVARFSQPLHLAIPPRKQYLLKENHGSRRSLSVC